MHESEKWKWVAQSYPTIRDPMDCSLPGSSIHGIFQARVLEWGAIAFSTHASKVMLKILQPRLQCEPWTSRCSSWFKKRQRNQRSNCQHPLDYQKSKRVPEKHLLLLYWLCQSLWLCGSQQTMENSSRDGLPDHLTCLLRNLYGGQKATVRTGHGTTDVPNRERSTLRLYIVTLLI